MHFRNSLSALAAVLLFLFLSGCGAKETATPSQRNAEDVINGMRLKTLTKQLNLTAEQQAQVKAMLDDEAKLVAQVHDEPKLTVWEKSVKVRALHDDTYIKIKPLLTPAQLESYESVLNKTLSKRSSK